MKKVYEKPQVCIEKFELNQHIASCEWNMEGNQDPSNCYAVQNGEKNLFITHDSCEETSGADVCTFNGGDNLDGAAVFVS